MQQNHILWEVQIPLIRYPPGLNMPLSEMMEEDEAFSGHKLSELIRRQRAAPPSASLQEAGDRTLPAVTRLEPGMKSRENRSGEVCN